MKLFFDCNRLQVKNVKKCFTKGFSDDILTEPSMRYTAMKVHELKKALIDLYTKIQDSQMAVFLLSLEYYMARFQHF